MQWYIQHNEDANGPYDLLQLIEFARQKVLLPDTMIWNVGSNEWVEARAMPFLWEPEPLMSIRSASPPPLPPPSETKPEYRHDRNAIKTRMPAESMTRGELYAGGPNAESPQDGRRNKGMKIGNVLSFFVVVAIVAVILNPRLLDRVERFNPTVYAYAENLYFGAETLVDPDERLDLLDAVPDNALGMAIIPILGQTFTMHQAEKNGSGGFQFRRVKYRDCRLVAAGVSRLNRVTPDRFEIKDGALVVEDLQICRGHF